MAVGRCWLLTAVIVGGGCTSTASSPPAPFEREEVTDVAFERVDLQEVCAADAAELGWAVPCPSALPVGAEGGCADGSCISIDQESGLRTTYFEAIFGDDGPVPGHLVLGAHPDGADDRRDPPCFRAEPLPALVTSAGEEEMFHCAGRPDEGFQHGEASHMDHDLVRWVEDGIVYIVSLHAGADDTRAVLRHLRDSIELVEP